MYISSCIIEVTRRCNLSCEHCLRGDQQKVDISDEILEKFFSSIKGSTLYTVTFTGGEPSIVPERINKVIDFAKKYYVEFENFYIATNAKEVSDEFLMAVIRLYSYCSDNEYSVINYSNDDFHDIDEENIKRLGIFRFTSPKYADDSMKYSYLINEGNAKKNGYGKRDAFKLYPNINPNDYVDIDNNSINDAIIYLNCKGNIICCCDLSYSSQNKKKHIICKAEDFTIEKVWEFWNNLSKKSLKST